VSTKVSLPCTDANSSYLEFGHEYPHGVVDRKKGQNAAGAMHTQMIEGFWSIFMLGIMGRYHNASKKISADVNRGVSIPQ
jgi:hypothetical protein